MFKQVMKKIGVIVLALTLLILDLTLLGAFPLLTQDGKFSLVEQIGYGVIPVPAFHCEVLDPLPWKKPSPNLPPG